jgi:hypothetical protein
MDTFDLGDHPVRIPVGDQTGPTDLKAELHHKLETARAGLLSKVDGLNEYDRRRPMTPTGTNLLGLIKHLAGLEYLYLGRSFSRPAPETMNWVEDGSIWEGADMWATAEESSDYLIGLYQRACRHGDHTIAELELDAPGVVPHWPEERRNTTLGGAAHPDGRRDRPARRPCRHHPGTHRRSRGTGSRHGRRRRLANLPSSDSGRR